MNFDEEYKKKLTTPAGIALRIQPGWTCVSDIALAVPNAICGAIGDAAASGALADVTLHTMLNTMPNPFLDEELRDSLHAVSWFSGAYERKAVNSGRADILPCSYHDMPSIIEERYEFDAYIAAVSPMDKHGYFSAGCDGSISFELMNKAKHIYLQVNKNMPRSLAGPAIHISRVDAVCEADEELAVLPPAKLDDISMTIGNLIAEEIPDGATIQLGIGAVPDAVGMALKNKRNLGIHTEMFTDSMVELIECGAVDNSLKPIHRWKTVAAFAFGSKRIYDFIDDNPGIEILPVDFVNDPAVIALHPDFMSINAALEVDFFGQVCAESIGTRHVSGTGGQTDYVRGATRSKGGKSFIAFPSTAKGGAISKIVPTLTPGAQVSTSKNDVDCIVTEYGIARLRGETLSRRTKALISIAHPKFRDELTFAAKKENIII